MSEQPTAGSRDHWHILDQIAETTLVLNSSLSTEEILEELMDASARIVNAKSASVILLDAKSRELHFVAMSTDADYSDKLIRSPVPFNSIAGTIVRENINMVLDDVSQSSIHFGGSDEQSGFVTQSLLGVPMRIKDRVVGALEAVNKLEGRWTEDDVRYLEILASQAAIALEKAELVRDLRKANKELSELDKVKSDFIAIASHELRTPLGVILGYASFLKEETQGELGSHATAVMNSALKMRSLIEDMTNLRLLNLGDRELQIDSYSMNNLIRSACNEVMSMVEAKGHQLAVGFLEEDLELHGDSAKLVTGLTNLLNNAIRFTPDNGKLEISLNNFDDEIRIKVMDNGIGIPEEKLEEIFKTFAQVEDHMTRKHGGMGLGLSISKAIFEAHKGKIWAESDGVNKGARIIVSLPKNRA